MSSFLQTNDDMEIVVDNHRFISGVRQALNLNYTRMLDVAKREWERRYVGKDPSDACVSVRISSSGPRKSSLACGGIIKKSKSFLNGNRRGLTT
jgi:hypothetical protein